MTKFTLSLQADIDTTACQESDNLAGDIIANVDLGPCTPVQFIAGFRVAPALAGGKFDGISSPRKVKAGQPVTVFGLGARFKASDTPLDPTKLYGLSTIAGEFDDAALVKCLRPVNNYDLQIIAVGMV
jgi:hypothetical protein